MITVRNLSFTYPKGNSPAADQLNFEIKAGEIFGFLGPSGAGKSTVQKILVKLIKGFIGEVHILGRPLRSWNADYYNHIGVGFELPNHYLKLTARENLRLFASFYDKPISAPMKLLESVGLGKDADKQVSGFSKGMKMRLNFVRAIMHDPDVLFFDEPTSGLDPVNARMLKDHILDLKRRGKTIFLTTHNMHDARELCDRVAFIVDGKIRLVDSPEKLELAHSRRNLAVTYINGQSQTRHFPLDNLGKNQEFLQLIDNYQLEAMHSEEASLEDIFIDVTGRRLV